ncbi:hypothetical protein JOB18_028444 [Solea senegalensis]|nr:hypothetical protein JOB18_028444 [Solea senegalensis]
MLRVCLPLGVQIHLTESDEPRRCTQAAVSVLYLGGKPGIRSPVARCHLGSRLSCRHVRLETLFWRAGSVCVISIVAIAPSLRIGGAAYCLYAQRGEERRQRERERSQAYTGCRWLRLFSCLCELSSPNIVLGKHTHTLLATSCFWCRIDRRVHSQQQCSYTLLMKGERKEERSASWTEEKRAREERQVTSSECAHDHLASLVPDAKPSHLLHTVSRKWTSLSRSVTTSLSSPLGSL